MSTSPTNLSIRQHQLRGASAEYLANLARAQRAGLYNIQTFKPPRPLERVKTPLHIQPREAKEEEPLRVPLEDDVDVNIGPDSQLVHDMLKQYEVRLSLSLEPTSNNPEL